MILSGRAGQRTKYKIVFAHICGQVLMSDNKKLMIMTTPTRLGGVIMTKMTNRKVVMAIMMEIRSGLHSKRDGSGLEDGRAVKKPDSLCPRGLNTSVSSPQQRQPSQDW